MSSHVPKDWHLSILGDIFKILKGSIIPQDQPSERLEYYSLPVFDQTGSSILVYGSEIESNKTLITEPAILVSKLNPRKPRVQVVKKSGAYRQCASTEFMAYAPKTIDLSLLFYKYYFVSEYFSDRLQLVATGSTNSHVRVTPSETLTWKVPNPPLPEQQKIATILSSVDKVIETTRAQIDKLKDLKTGMMQELLTKGIGVDGVLHTEFKDSPVGRIPVSWDVLAISQVCSEIVDCVNKTAPVVDYVTPYKMIRTTNVRDGRIDTTNVRFVTQETYSTWTRRIDLKPDDLIFTREAPVGECGIIQDASGLFLGQRTMVYRVNPEIFDHLFLLWSVQSEFWKTQVDDLSGGSTTPHLRVPDCSRILVKVPPLAEQKIISNAINSVESLLNQRQLKLAKIEQVKKALMQDLLTGKVRVKIDEKEKEPAVA